jgi:putative FmdB family regulatory protein
MPFYEYECQNCKFYTELMQKITDPPLEKCPSCGKKTMQKLISAPVFRLKGSGWYETDFKGDNENKRNLAGAEKEEPKAETPSDSTKPAEAKADAKPEAAAESKPAAEPKRQGASSSGKRGSSGGGRSAARPSVAAAKGKSKQAAKAASKPSAKSKPKAKAKGKAGKGRR